MRIVEFFVYCLELFVVFAKWDLKVLTRNDSYSNLTGDVLILTLKGSFYIF